MRRIFRVPVTALVVATMAVGGLLVIPAAARPTRVESSSYSGTVKKAIADIQEFWREEFPLLYGDKYEPVPQSRIIAARPGVKLPRCQGESGKYVDVKGNAFYAGGCNFVAYDDANLFPELAANFGDIALTFVLAHEWGHAVQDRAGTIDNAPIDVELQADCFAGAWTQRVADGHSPIKLKGGDLDAALAAVLSVRDPVGGSSEDQQAHGSGFDRVSAFQEGFEGGAESCVDYFTNPPLTVEIPFTSEEDFVNEGDLPLDDVLPSTVDLLNDFYSKIAPDVYKPLTIDDLTAYDSSVGDRPKCGSTKLAKKDVANRVFYCIDDGYIGFDEPYVQRVYDTIGDFGVTTLFANTWATYVQLLQGFPGAKDNKDNAVLGADCYTGGFAAAMFNGVLLVQPDGKPKFQLSPGDLDETIQAFLDYNQAREVEPTADLTFLRVKTFKNGFLQGYKSCSSFANA